MLNSKQLRKLNLLRGKEQSISPRLVEAALEVASRRLVALPSGSVLESVELCFDEYIIHIRLRKGHDLYSRTASQRIHDNGMSHTECSAIFHCGARRKNHEISCPCSLQSIPQGYIYRPRLWAITSPRSRHKNDLHHLQADCEAD